MVVQDLYYYRDKRAFTEVHRREQGFVPKQRRVLYSRDIYRRDMSSREVVATSYSVAGCLMHLGLEPHAMQDLAGGACWPGSRQHDFTTATLNMCMGYVPHHLIGRALLNLTTPEPGALIAPQGACITVITSITSIIPIVRSMPACAYTVAKVPQDGIRSMLHICLSCGFRVKRGFVL